MQKPFETGVISTIYRGQQPERRFNLKYISYNAHWQFLESSIEMQGAEVVGDQYVYGMAHSGNPHQ